MVDAHDEALNNACIQALDALNRLVQECGGGTPPFTLVPPESGNNQQEQWYEESRDRLESDNPDPWLDRLMLEAGRSAEALDNAALRAQFGRQVETLSSLLFALGQDYGTVIQRTGWGVREIQALRDRFVESWRSSREFADRITSHLHRVPTIELLCEVRRRGHWYCRVRVDGNEEKITRQLTEGILALNQTGKVIEFPSRQLQQGTSAEKPWVRRLFSLVASTTRSGYYADYTCPTFRGLLRDSRPADGRTFKAYQRHSH